MIQKVNYLADIKYSFGRYIREYDIRKANISILFELGILSKEKYEELYNADRMYRQVYIGKLIRSNSSIGEALKNGIADSKNKFFEANGILDSDILSIKNDAVFIMDKIAKATSFGNIKFVLKNTYDTFMQLDKIQLYYGSNLDREVIDVKGIKDEDLEIYHMPFLSIIIEFIRTMNTFGPEEALDFINSIMDAYIRKELSIECYRCFRSNSGYSMPTKTMGYAILTTPNDYNVDFNYNFALLRQMYGYAVECLRKKIEG